jgi:hypothetical protein
MADKIISIGKSQVIKDDTARRLASACLNAAEMFAQASTEAQSAQPIKSESAHVAAGISPTD